MFANRWIPHLAGTVLAGAVVVALVGATPASAQTLPQGMEGHYTLVEAAGHPLPYAPVEPGRPADAPPLEVLASTLVVQPDGHFIMAMAYRVKQGGTERFFTNPFTGTITRDTTGFVMHWDGAGLTPATWQAERFTFTNEGQEFAYRRQGPPRPSGK